MQNIRRTVDFTKISFKSDLKGEEHTIILFGSFSRPRAERYIKREYGIKHVLITRLETWSESRKMDLKTFVDFSQLVSNTEKVLHI